MSLCFKYRMYLILCVLIINILGRTALTVDAPWGHRAAVRYDGVVRYGTMALPLNKNYSMSAYLLFYNRLIVCYVTVLYLVGFAVPQAVYVDYDIIRAAPKRLNLSGVGDVWCFQTAQWDWQLARDHGKEGNWPYDASAVARAQTYLDRLMANIDNIKEMNDDGIATIVSAFQFGGAAFHGYGWNPRPVEGFEHLFFYALEHRTHKHFIHGYPVMLGIFFGYLLHGNIYIYI